MDVLIVYGSYLLFLLIPLFILLICTQKKPWGYALGLLFFLFCFYIRFVEPAMLISRFENFTFSGETQNISLKAAVFSDPQIGIFKSPAFLERIVNTINAQNVDIVFIAGDLIDNLNQDELPNALAPLKKIQAPTYMVTGNHDTITRSNIDGDYMREHMSEYGISILDNQVDKINIKGTTLTLAGVSDLWEGVSDFSVLDSITEEENSIVLVHNPDAVYYFPHNNIDIVFAGHTHGGQIKIPFLYKHMIPTKADFEKGWYTFDSMKLFITSGTGEANLPMRFLVPPEIVFFDFTL